MDRVLGSLAAVFVSHLHADHHTVSAGQGSSRGWLLLFFPLAPKCAQSFGLSSCEVMVFHKPQCSSSAHKNVLSFCLLCCPVAIGGFAFTQVVFNFLPWPAQRKLQHEVRGLSSRGSWAPSHCPLFSDHVGGEISGHASARASSHSSSVRGWCPTESWDPLQHEDLMTPAQGWVWKCLTRISFLLPRAC